MLPSPLFFILPLTEPWASSCWLNFLDDVRVHVHRPCRWCFWMNECPLPSPLLVLRDVYKSRSPGQPAEFHEIPRRRRETRDSKGKSISERLFDFTEHYAAAQTMICRQARTRIYEHICLHLVLTQRGGKRQNCAYLIVCWSQKVKKCQLDQGTPRGKLPFPLCHCVFHRVEIWTHYTKAVSLHVWQENTTTTVLNRCKFSLFLSTREGFFSPCVPFLESTVDYRGWKLLQCESLWRTWAVTSVKEAENLL